MGYKFKVYLKATRNAINNQQTNNRNDQAQGKQTTNSQPTTNNNKQQTTNNKQQNPPQSQVGGLINLCFLQSASAKFDKILFNRDVIAFKKILS